MINISNSLKEIIQSNPYLQFGFAHRLLNLTQLAKFIKPIVECRTKKEIKTTALVMNLSRLQKVYTKIMPQTKDFILDSINISSNLLTVTYNKTESNQKNTSKLHELIKKKNGYINITESNKEITLVTEGRYFDLIDKTIDEKPKYINKGVSAISVSFNEKYYDYPGILYVLFQQLTLQGINVIELSSTFTEVILYVEEKDVKLAFDTLFYRFVGQKTE
ncbi:hypothetical protein ACFLZH_04105 [Patescibacteria group bacterium]